MQFTVITLFPDLINGFLSQGLMRQAIERGQARVSTLNPRQFTQDVHQTVDDRAFGGGDGMVMKVEPLRLAVESLRAQGPCRVAVLSPQGRVWNQRLAREYAELKENVVLVCGRYAGIDHRFTVQEADDEVSIGDYILNGGEIGALAILESVVRLQPGVLGNRASAQNDSFSRDLLECPQFTRPQEGVGLKVPAPLLSGHHAEIRVFELAVSRVRTAVLRPDLLAPGEILVREVQLLQALPENELRSLGLEREQLKSLLAGGR